MKKSQKPNILLITLHDLGDYLGCYGTPVETPHIDSIARNGVLFENQFAAAPMCSPARGAMLTGCYPHTNGLMGLVHRGWALDTEKCPTFPQILEDNGYEASLFGFQHEHYDPMALGYRNVFKEKSTHCEDVVPLFTGWLTERMRSDEQANPFFASVAFSEVHRMGMKPSHFKREGYLPVTPENVSVRPYLPDIPEIRNDLADFYGAIRYTDQWIGKLLEAVRQAGLTEQTLIIFTTDHGASFIHSKATLYEGGTKIALLMQYKGVLPEGRRVSSLTSQVDILPTLLDLLGLQAGNAPIQGVSQKPVLLDEPEKPQREYCFSEENYNTHFMPTRAVRSDRFRYIRNGFPVCVYDFQIPEIELSSFSFRSNDDVFNFYPARRSEEELFDLENDPGERENLVDSLEYAGVLQRHREALRDHMEATGDPFAGFSHGGLTLPADTYAVIREENQKQI